MKINQIYHGDNLHFLKEMLGNSIDSMYIDPPFGTQSLWSSAAWKGQKVQEMTFYDYFGGGIEGYLNFIEPRLRQMHRVLKPSGSLFVHLDWRAAHYVKVVLDEIFSVENPTSKNTNFVNEIIWKRTNSPKSQAKACGTQHDTILWYVKNRKQAKIFKPDRPRTFEEVDKNFPHFDSGGRFRTISLIAAGQQRREDRKVFEFEGVKEQWLYSLEALNFLKLSGRIYKTSGGSIRKKEYDRETSGRVFCSDLWIDDEVSAFQGGGGEGTGYPTQKPINLLKRIINASTEKGDIVADFFCGCGTAIDAAQTLERNWIGIDASMTACEVMAKRMQDKHSLIVGIDKKPMTYDEFSALEPFEFEKATVRHIGGVANDVQVGDGGIDGRLAFDGTPIQVKKESKPLGDSDRFRAFYPHIKKHGRGIFITLNGYTSKAKQRAEQWRREGLDIQLLSLKDVVKGNYREQPIVSKN